TSSTASPTPSARASSAPSTPTRGRSRRRRPTAPAKRPRSSHGGRDGRVADRTGLDGGGAGGAARPCAAAPAQLLRQLGGDDAGARLAPLLLRGRYRA